MPKQVAYFDSQACAAASLGIDIYEIKAAKAEGCPAFRSGRVYKKELLAWLKEKRRQEGSDAEAEPTDDDYKLRKRRDILGRTLLGLAECANLGVLTDEQYHKFGSTIAVAGKDEAVLKLFIDVGLEWAFNNHDDLVDAYNKHPKIVKWLLQKYETNQHLWPEHLEDDDGSANKAENPAQAGGSKAAERKR